MKSILAFSFCLLFVYTSCFAQEIIPLWKENTIPNYQKSEGKEEVIKQDIIRIKDITNRRWGSGYSCSTI